MIKAPTGRIKLRKYEFLEANRFGASREQNGEHFRADSWSARRCIVGRGGWIPVKGGASAAVTGSVKWP